METIKVRVTKAKPSYWYADKKQLIDFHIEVMKLGLIKEGSPKWAEHYEPFVRKVASDYYDQAFLNREEGKK